MCVIRGEDDSHNGNSVDNDDAEFDLPGDDCATSSLLVLWHSRSAISERPSPTTCALCGSATTWRLQGDHCIGFYSNQKKEKLGMSIERRREASERHHLTRPESLFITTITQRCALSNRTTKQSRSPRFDSIRFNSTPSCTTWATHRTLT